MWARTLQVSGLGIFAASLGLLAWWWTIVAGRAAGPLSARAAALDLALFTAFALHHSALARPGPQRWLASHVPPDLVRTSYVWTASVLLIGVCLLWQPVGGTVYALRGIPAAVLRLLQLAGLVVLVLAVRRIRVAELAGLVPTRAGEPLQVRGPYALVRHPIYLGWVLVFGATPHMTADRLLFFGVSTAYLCVAVPYEEAGLRRQFGSRYDTYRAAVRWRIVPFLY